MAFSFYTWSLFITAASTPSIMNYEKTPQQLNCECVCVHKSMTYSITFAAHDCGVYVLCFAELICRKELLQDQQSVLSIATADYVSKWRADTTNLVHKLASK